MKIGKILLIPMLLFLPFLILEKIHGTTKGDNILKWTVYQASILVTNAVKILG
jgi:hypothetical protein